MQFPRECQAQSIAIAVSDVDRWSIIIRPRNYLLSQVDVMSVRLTTEDITTVSRQTSERQLAASCGCCCMTSIVVLVEYFLTRRCQRLKHCKHRQFNFSSSPEPFDAFCSVNCINCLSIGKLFRCRRNTISSLPIGIHSERRPNDSNRSDAQHLV